METPVLLSVLSIDLESLSDSKAGYKVRFFEIQKLVTQKTSKARHFTGMISDSNILQTDRVEPFRENQGALGRFLRLTN